MENARMLAAMVSRAPVRAVIPENTATHMSVRSYLTQLCGYLEKNSHYRLFNESPRTLVGKSWSVYLYFSLAHRRLGNFSSRETCIFNR